MPSPRRSSGTLHAPSMTRYSMTRSQSASDSVHPRPILTGVPPRLTVGCPTLTGFGRVGELADRLWDFSLFRPFLWDLWDKRGWGPAKPRVNQLANFNVQLTTVFPRVTWAYCADSIESYKKLEANNRCDHNDRVIAESTHPDFQLSLPGVITGGPPWPVLLGWVESRSSGKLREYGRNT